MEPRLARPCPRSLSLSRAAALLLAAALTVAGLAAAPARADEGAVGGRPAYDVRAGERAAVAAEVREARTALDGTLGALGSVDGDVATGGVDDVRRADGFLTGPSRADAADVALGYVRARPEVFGLDAGDLAALRLEARSTSPDGLTTLRWVQTVDGIASLDTGVVAHVAPDGRLISVGGGARADLAVRDADAALGPAAAYREALADAGGALVAPRATATGAGPERATRFADGGSARLAVLAGPGGGRLVWRTVAYDDDGLGYEQALDADTGAVLVRRPLTAHESRAEVFRRYPGAATGGTAQTVDLAADPLWLNDAAGGTRLQGNNVHAYTDRNANNAADADEEVPPSGGSDWLYPLRRPATVTAPCPPEPAYCTWNSADAATLALNESSSAVNLFFHANLYHDHLAAGPIGFDEASGNFQQVNLTGRGLGGDRVAAENNDASGFDNANFATPPDGNAPRMQMFARKSAYDLQGSHSAETIYHEYTHGLTNRLVVAPGGSSTLVNEQARSMGEGWSDWFALDFLADAGYAVDGPAAGDLSYGAYWNGTGIRSEAIDCRVTDSGGRCGSGGGYTYQDIRGLVAPHTSGEMWSQTLWDVRRAIGSSEARRLVTGGLRLSPADPTYVDMRDAILQADLATGGTHYAALWQAFAARGLGFGASSDRTSVGGATEAFDLPPAVVADDPAVRDLDGDRDGVPEPGETVTFRPSVRNTSVAALDAGGATVASATDGVTVVDGATSFAGVPTLDSATAEDDVTVRIDPSVACGTPARLSVAAAGGGAALPFLLRAGAPVAPSGTAWSSAAPNAAIPETYAGVSSTITVPGPGVPIQDLDLRIDQLQHTWLGDLRILLSHDGGPKRTLVDHARGGDLRGGTLAGMVFDDQAASPFATIAVGSAPVTGRYRPLSALRAFEGEATAGTWTLTVIDDWSGSTGTLGGWSLGFSTRSTGCEDNSAVAASAAATGVSATGATIGGTVDAAGAATEYRIVWGETDAYGSSTPVASAGAARGATARTTALTGLAPETTYHFRVEALRFGEVADVGEDRTFTTAVVPPPPPDPDPEPVTPDPDPTPVTPDPTPVTPDPTPVTPDPTPVTPDPTPATPDPKPATPDPQPVVTPPTTNQPTDAGGGAPARPASPSAPSGPAGGGSGAPGGGLLTVPEITIAPRSAPLAFATTAKTVRAKAGRVTLRLTAPAGARGTLTLRAGTRTLGTARFTARADGTATVTVTLTAKGRATLARAHGRRLATTARATAAGRTATRKLTLRG